MKYVDLQLIKKALITLHEVKNELVIYLRIIIPLVFVFFIVPTILLIVPILVTIVNFFTILFQQIINEFYYQQYKEFFLKIKKNRSY